MPPGDVLRKYRLVLRFRAERIAAWSSVVRRRATARGGGVWRSGADGLARPRATVTVWGCYDHPHVRDDRSRVRRVWFRSARKKHIMNHRTNSSRNDPKKSHRALRIRRCGFAASTQSRTTQREAAFSGRACLAGWQCFVQRFVSRSEDSDSLRARRGRRGRRRPQSRHRPGRHRTPCRPWR